MGLIRYHRAGHDFQFRLHGAKRRGLRLARARDVSGWRVFRLDGIRHCHFRRWRVGWRRTRPGDPGGGSVSTDLNTFKGEASFWGHGVNPNSNNVMKLGPMMERLTNVFHWGPLLITGKKIEAEFPTDLPY